MLEVEYYLKVLRLNGNLAKASKLKNCLDEACKEARCVSDGKVLPLTLMPLLLNRQELSLLQTTSEILYGAIQKTIEAILTSARVRQYFNYDEIPQEWLNSNPGYKQHAVFARLDAFFYGKNLKYLEFNTDYPGFQAWADTIRSVVATHPFYKSLVTFPEEELQPTLLEAGVAAIRSIYQEFSQKNVVPNVAFVDYRDAGYSPDTQLVVEFCHKNGINAFLADPREIKLKEDGAYVGNQKVDMVRRTMKANKLLSYPNELQPFIKGYLNRTFCMLNSFRAVYGSEKSLFALMSNPDFHSLYDKDEVQVIRKHIPWTRRLADLETTSAEGNKIVLADFLKQQREAMVIKPSGKYSSDDLIVGKNTPAAEWDKLVVEHLGSKDWVAQEYLCPPSMPMPVIVDKKAIVKKKFFQLSAFITCGRYAGVLGRVSDSSLLTMTGGGGILPVIKY